jgi:hypothetical protein
MESVVAELLKRLRPKESPLIVAREFLISRDFTPPIVTDEWWLDVVEFKESELRFPDLNVGHRWIFPLPYDAPDHGKERGLNIAWTALQLDWMQEGSEQGYCQVTEPKLIHKYIRSWPGLFECCRANPEILALYAPQLTIPGLDDGFSDVFDELLNRPYRNSLQFFSYDSPDTIDGEEPLCGEAIAWRHSTFGNYIGELASSFADAHTLHYLRTVYEGFTCLTWLLTDAAGWLPERVRSRLINGMRVKTHSWAADTHFGGSDNVFQDALWRSARSRFRFSLSIRMGLEDLIGRALKELRIAESAGTVAQRFIKGGFVEGYFAEKDRWRKRVSGRRKRSTTAPT